MTAVIGRVGGEQPPALPAEEMRAMAATLQQYALAWSAWGEEQVDYQDVAASAFRIADSLADAAMHLRNLDYRTAALLQKGA